MSINRLFEMSRRSLVSLDAAINTTGQNIANANTEGYARRRVTLSADTIAGGGLHIRPEPGTFNGLGVSATDFERVRDTMLLQAGWEAQAGSRGATEEARLMRSLEALFPQGEGSLHNLLDDFWNGWSQVADYPTDEGVRQALLGRADALAATLNRMDHDLVRLGEDVTNQLEEGVDKLNGMLDKVAELNQQIATARQQGAPDFAAEDRRDGLLRDIGAYGPLRVTESETGTMTVRLGGMTVVDGSNVVPLQVGDDDGTPVVTVGSANVAYTASGAQDGKLGAWLGGLDVIAEKREALDTLAFGIASEINDLHVEGFGLDGTTDVPFFEPYDPTDPDVVITASNIRLGEAVRNDPRAIAASGEDGQWGDSSVALDIAGLRTADLAGDQSAEEYVTSLISDIGSRVQQAESAATAGNAMADYLDAMERGVSGVNLDEELTNLIKYQQSYAASARILTTAQSMFDTLLAM